MAEKNNRFVCSICLDDFRKPKIIDCHHTYCEHCLEDYVQKFAKNNRFLCPLCREEINIPVGGVKKFTSNIYIEEKSVGSNKIQQCDVCIKVPSEFKCAECEQYLCNSCKTNHVLNAHKHNENVNVRRKSFCKKHTSEILDFYCRECSEIICIKCLMSRHKDHTTPDLDDFGEEVSVKLEENKQALVKIVNKFKGAVTAIDSQTSRQRQQFDLSCDEVDERIAEICRTSRETGEQLKADMKKLIEEDEGETKKIKEDYENLISTLGASLSHADESLKDPTVGELLTISDSLTSQRKANEDKKAIIPNSRPFKFNKGLLDIDQVSHQVGFVTQGAQNSDGIFNVLTSSNSDVVSGTPIHDSSNSAVVSCMPILDSSNSVDGVSGTPIIDSSNSVGVSGTPIHNSPNSDGVFQVRFNKMDIERNEVCSIPDFKIQGLKWSFRACTSLAQSLCLQLGLSTDNVFEEYCKAIEFWFSITLFNIKDDALSLVRKAKVACYTNQQKFYEWSNIISLADLFDPSRGFIDDHGNFHIKIIIHGNMGELIADSIREIGKALMEAFSK
ncbi:hypothetical protein SNE40_006232 [Patella caerulea]|uniref:Uncharacterized protein n=1 Tax=Patella caerulea TaxID=87958 RepID=A0AAN8K738_PATCE